MPRARHFAPALLLLLSACATTTVNSYFAPTAAVVGNSRIPEAKVSEEMRIRIEDDEQFAELLRGPNGRRNRLDAQRFILSELIHLEVLRQEAVTLGIRVSEEEVAERLDEARRQFATEAEFEERLTQLGLTIASASENIRTQLLLQRVREEIGKEVSVSEEQLREFYEGNLETFQAQIHLAHILVCESIHPVTGQCQATPQDRDTAESLAARARAGEDFADLARRHSQDPDTSDQGGDLGWTSRGRFFSSFEEVAFSLEAGEVSDPVSTDFGWHVIKAIAVGRSFEEARDEMEALLIREPQEEAFREWLTSAIQEMAPRIRVNAKFGRFDPGTLSVVPIETPARA